MERPTPSPAQRRSTAVNKTGLTTHKSYFLHVLQIEEGFHQLSAEGLEKSLRLARDTREI